MNRTQQKMPVAAAHTVLGNALLPPYPPHLECALFGLGCFWGAERVFWRQPGVWTTAVGYAGGATANPSYEQVCSGRTGHNEVVRVVFAPEQITYARLLEIFFEAHDPTQGMRQGNDVGAQYRSGIYTADAAQMSAALQARQHYARVLAEAGYGPITTEIIAAPKFYFAEDYHQQYLDKNPGGYCGLGGTGIKCALPNAAPTSADVQT